MVLFLFLLTNPKGASWPAIHPMAAVWIKPMDRSKFVSNMMASSLGAAVAMPICGFLISYIGWESVFYVTGNVIQVRNIYTTCTKLPRVQHT